MQLQPFALERHFARHEFSTRFLMSSSDCESWSTREILALEPGSEERYLSLRLGYTESTGAPALREAISKIYERIDPAQVLVHSGAEEAILLFMQAALAPGDEIVVHTPCYQALAEIPRAIGCKVVPWKAREDAGWALELEELKKLLTAKTRAIVVNLPHNPTGYLMDAGNFRALSKLAEEKGILLFCDEVYRESEHDPRDRLPAACDLSANAVSLGVTSKTYGLAGLRIGWVATRNAKILQRMAELKDYTTICNSAPSEVLAEIGLRHRERLAKRNRDVIAANLKSLEAFFARHPDLFEWRAPKAGPIAFPKLRAGDADAFCEKVIAKAGVMLLPGSVFGADYRANFRVGFGRRNLPEALGSLDAALELFAR